MKKTLYCGSALTQSNRFTVAMEADLLYTVELDTTHNAQFYSAERIVLFVVFIFVFELNGQVI